MDIHYSPIGIVHSPFDEVAGMPIQPAAAIGVKGTIVLNPGLTEGLRDLDGFSHIILLYHFHRTTGYALQVTPFLDTQTHGVFATRAPRRPNAIGFSVVRLVEIAGNELAIENVDLLDGTPLLDIKPYIPEMDTHSSERAGWFENARERLKTARADQRFQ